MKNLSFWALTNPWKAQTIIVICQLFLTFSAIYVGVWLFAHDIIVPTACLYVGEILFLIALILYPIRRARHKFWKANFVRQKTMDGVFLLSFLFMSITVSNTDARLAWNEKEDAPIVTPIAMKENTQPTLENAQKPAVLSRKELRRQFKSFVSNMKRDAENGDNKAGKILGVILLMLLSMFVVLVLSCFVFCSAAGGFGYVVLGGGFLLILVLGTKAIRDINGRRPSNYQPTPPTPNHEKT